MPHNTRPNKSAPERATRMASISLASAANRALAPTAPTRATEETAPHAVARSTGKAFRLPHQLLAAAVVSAAPVGSAGRNLLPPTSTSAAGNGPSTRHDDV